MAPSAYISLVLDPTSKSALQTCIDRIQSTSPVPLDPMSTLEMHMTLVFLGSNLRSLPPPKRTELDGIIAAFSTDVTTTTTAAAALEFNRLELFPPTKRNLLVAMYKIGTGNLEALSRLQKACLDLGVLSREEHVKFEQGDFVAHVTLGKFRGMKAEQSTAVERVVNRVSEGLDESIVRSLGLPFNELCLRGADWERWYGKWRLDVEWESTIGTYIQYLG